MDKKGNVYLFCRMQAVTAALFLLSALILAVSFLSGLSERRPVWLWAAVLRYWPPSAGSIIYG